MFYCYDNSALAIEAVFCHCPTVFIPNDHLAESLSQDEIGTDGYAMGLDPAGIAQAKKTVKQGRETYLKCINDVFPAQLEKFIADTQAKANSVKSQYPITVSSDEAETITVIQSTPRRKYFSMSRKKYQLTVELHPNAEQQNRWHVAWRIFRKIGLLFAIRYLRYQGFSKHK